MLVKDGLAMIADTRTNAGLDNVSSYKKLHLVDQPGDRVLAVATAGNLSMTQTALALVREGVRLTPEDHSETLTNVPTLFRCAQLLGHALREVRRDIAPSLQAESLNASASMLLGGQIAGGKMGLYLIYSAGNFIECGADTPFLQIGEFKYGKPILDRALTPSCPLAHAVKLGLLSMDSTIRSNIAVGGPFDLMTTRRDTLEMETRRIESDDPYFRGLGMDWSEALNTAVSALPSPPWMRESGRG